MTTSQRFSELGAAERVAALLDEDSFQSLRHCADGGALLVGRGRLGGRQACVAVTDGRIKGGTFGCREAALLGRLLEEADAFDRHGRPLLVIVFDTGGVRVEEGPAALAALSATAVSLARLVLRGTRALSIISGPRGCFGAPAVMAAIPERVAMIAGSHWGLTGPRLIGRPEEGAAVGRAGFEAMSAAARKLGRDAHAVIADHAAAVRAEAVRFAAAPSLVSPSEQIQRSARRAAAMRARLRHSKAWRTPRQPRRRRDLLRHSFGGLWKAGKVRRGGLVEAALGTLAGRPALGLVIGPERSETSGVGIEEAALVTEMVSRVARLPGEPAAILVFLFCQGHAVDVTQERFGLPRALAECLRALVAARLRGHPVVTVLGGGAYGAAYLALAAPSHRILALRGTSIAPMAPELLHAFESLRGRKPDTTAKGQIADLVPQIRIVESIIRLPRALREELQLVGAGIGTLPGH